MDADVGLLLSWIDTEPWVALDAEVMKGVRDAGLVADELASQESLLSSDTVREKLQAAVQGSPLDKLPVDRLIRLACRASRRAAMSSRLEIYPRGLQSDRLLALCANTVLATGQISVSELQEKVRARYPEANPFPERPELDRLMEGQGFEFSVGGDGAFYRRRGAQASTFSSTIMPPIPLAAAATRQPLRYTPGAVEARIFQETISVALSKGFFRVVQVQGDFSEAAARKLESDFRFQVVSVDHKVWEKVQVLAAQEGITLDDVVGADREGPSGSQWGPLRDLVRDAATAVINEVLEARRRPTLLVRVGVLGQFGLEGALRLLLDRAQKEDGAAIFLLVPGYDDGTGPSINRIIAVPTIIPSQCVTLPRAWLVNEHIAPREDA